MTNDEWNTFEETLEHCPPIVVEMYTAPRLEMNRDEFVALTNAILVATTTMERLAHQKSVSQSDFVQFAGAMDRLFQGMYGRMLSLGRALDRSHTAQVLLEAELATTGK